VFQFQLGEIILFVICISFAFLFWREKRRTRSLSAKQKYELLFEETEVLEGVINKFLKEHNRLPTSIEDLCGDQGMSYDFDNAVTGKRDSAIDVTGDSLHAEMTKLRPDSIVFRYGHPPDTNMGKCLISVTGSRGQCLYRVILHRQARGHLTLITKVSANG